MLAQGLGDGRDGVVASFALFAPRASADLALIDPAPDVAFLRPAGKMGIWS